MSECVCVVRSCLVRFACGPQPTNPHLDHVEVYSKSVLTHIGWRRLKPMALSSHSRAQRFSSRKTFRRRVISRRLRQKQSPPSRARKLKKLTRKDFASDEKSSTCRVGVAVQPTRKGAPSLRAQPTGGHQFAAHWPLAQPENHKSKTEHGGGTGQHLLDAGRTSGLLLLNYRRAMCWQDNRHEPSAGETI